MQKCAHSKLQICVHVWNWNMGISLVFRRKVCVKQIQGPHSCNLWPRCVCVCKCVVQIPQEFTALTKNPSYLPWSHLVNNGHSVKAAHSVPALILVNTPGWFYILHSQIYFSPDILLTNVQLVTLWQCLIWLDGATVGCRARCLYSHTDQAPGTRVQRGLQPRREASGQRLLW